MSYNPLFDTPVYDNGKLVDTIPASWVAHNEMKGDNEAFRANFNAWAANAKKVSVDGDGMRAPKIDDYDARIVGR